MALPVLKGLKTPNERFAGAEETYCIEGLMQDGKALQAGTSHFLGQNFSRSFDVQFTSKEGKLEYPWATSWGVSTRLMGALIMAHSDDNGLVLPPRLAPVQVVIVPIYKSEEDLARISEKVNPIFEELKAKGISVKYDDDDKQRSGWKFAEYELRGVPVRLGIGLRDLENGTIEVARRDTLTKESRSLEGVAGYVADLLDEIQTNIYQKALHFREQNTFRVDTWEDFKTQIEKGGFISAHWDGSGETEEKIKEETKATIRCIPMDAPAEAGADVYSGKPSNKRVIFARAY
ncbi:MAG TPA: His/Gly/Thr/Pro-type tRNA ligase C-terminal domain-containing protein, partial [Pyrinomonadaceae bacterium]|nr:His/Gly/Thr/Pro-type tRNA ligase C-terminal domain-containing protein [Pyrinomonadaceae bacterium]